MPEFISIRGCRLHNLKNVDAQFPLGKITVVCGPSGCGKSTLVLDTLHGESKRRYLETLSPFAAELLGGRRIIPLDSADGLPASLAVGPSHGEAPAKAYALSISECDNTLRALFAAYARPACPECGKPMESQSRENIIREIAGLPQGTKLQFLAKVESASNLDKLSAVFLAQGFTRALADGVSYSLADLTDSERRIVPEEFFIVVDRVIVRENTRTRIAEAVDGALKLTHGGRFTAPCHAVRTTESSFQGHLPQKTSRPTPARAFALNVQGPASSNQKTATRVPNVLAARDSG